MFKFYEVGGKVRDHYLGLTSKDIDFVAVPDEDILPAIGTIQIAFELLVKYLEEQGFEIFLKTPEMFTIRAKFPKTHKNFGITADFVLARKELNYEEGTRRPVIVPGTLLDDLTRRDFTVNAIAIDEDGKVYDPFNGRNDILKKVLRTPIKADITFADDPLRLLRAMRFAVTKGFSISTDIDMIIRYFDYWNKFHVVSEERIREELYKCFKANTHKTLMYFETYKNLRDYVFKRTTLWLKPTNEK